MGRSSRVRTEHFLDWKYSCIQFRSAKAMCTAAVARFLSRVIVVLLRHVRYKKRLKGKAKLSIERKRGSFAADVFSCWFALSTRTRRLRRAFQSVSRRTWTQTLGVVMVGWHAVSKRRRFVKKALATHLGRRATMDMAQFLEVWNASTKSSRDMLTTERSCKSR
jgi:hypothetical protein